MCKYLRVAVVATPLLLTSALHAAPTMLPIPRAKLPSPNGYDLLMRAGKSLKSGGSGSPGASEKLSPAEDLKRQRAYTAKNATALRLMQQALQLPIVSPPVRSNDIRFPDYAKLRELARLGVQQSRVLYADKQLNGAVQSALDTVEVSAATERGTNVIGMLVSVATQAIGRQDLWKWRAECDAATAMRAVRRLDAIEAKTPSLTAIFQEEKWNWLSSIQVTLASPEWKKFRRGDASGLSDLTKNPRDIARLRRTSDLDIQRDFVRAMDAVIAQSRWPYSRRPPRIALGPPPPFLGEETVQIFQSSTRGQYERGRVTNRLLLTSFALQAFKREHGNFPISLNELRPKYLQSLPRDSFAQNAPLRYKRNATDFTLYSVGPDGVDNGGKPIAGRIVGPRSLGDLVVGFFR